MKGLFLKIGKTAKTWVVQREVRLQPVRRTVRRAFAAFPEMGVKEARDRATGELAAILAGEGLGKPKAGITLGEAWGLYRVALEKMRRSPATIYSYRNAVESDHLLGIWHDTELSDLATKAGYTRVAQRHDAITAGQTHEKHGGSYAANGAMRTLRAIYNWADISAQTQRAGTRPSK